MTRLVARAFGRRLGRMDGCTWIVMQRSGTSFLYPRLSQRFAEAGNTMAIAALLHKFSAGGPVLTAVCSTSAMGLFGSAVCMVIAVWADIVVGRFCTTTRFTSSGSCVTQRAMEPRGHGRFCGMDREHGRQAARAETLCGKVRARAKQAVIVYVVRQRIHKDSERKRESERTI